jgi:hypothetical protein
MSAIKRKAAASLVPGDRFIRAPYVEGRVRLVYTVDHVTRGAYGIVSIWHGKYGLQHVDAAGTHRFELAP